MAKISYVVRLFDRADDGTINDLSEEYSLKEFGDTVPASGDHIVSPWLSNSKDKHSNPLNRTIYEVRERYFMPINIDPDKDVLVYIGTGIISISPAIAQRELR